MRRDLPPMPGHLAAAAAAAASARASCACDSDYQHNCAPSGQPPAQAAATHVIMHGQNQRKPTPRRNSDPLRWLSGRRDSWPSSAGEDISGRSAGADRSAPSADASPASHSPMNYSPHQPLSPAPAWGSTGHVPGQSGGGGLRALAAALDGDVHIPAHQAASGANFLPAAAQMKQSAAMNQKSAAAAASASASSAVPSGSSAESAAAAGAADQNPIADALASWWPFKSDEAGSKDSTGANGRTPPASNGRSPASRSGPQVVIDCTELGGASRSATWSMSADLTLRDARDSAAQKFGLHADQIEICIGGAAQTAPWLVNARLGSLKEDGDSSPLKVQVRTKA